MLEQICDKKIFTYFEEISKIPRGSYHNEKISEYLVEFAKKHDLEYRVDEALNVVIKKPASADCKNQEPILLQGHMDMVCVSEDGTHDFENEGLLLHLNGDYLEAEGTTLGGDDGIALAYILTILDSSDYTHPPIEAVFTTDEEVGMDGATALDTSDLRAKMMINIDNEEEGVLLVSCAGGASADFTFRQEKKPAAGQEIAVRVSGLAGGHSGTEIAKHPLNASIFLGKILALSYEEIPFSLVSFTGGDKDNVITNAAECHIICEKQAEELSSLLKWQAQTLMGEVLSAEPDIRITVDCCDESSPVCFDDTFTKAILSFLNLTITGVQVFSSDIPGMVESSLNMGIARTEEDGIVFGFSVRSQKETYREYMLKQLEWLLECVCFSTGITHSFHVRGRYPAWDYKKDSRLRELMIQEFRNCFEKEPVVEGIHAGLECGILAKKMPGIDIVSMGPDIENIHTVNERMSISSAKRNFDYILRVLEKIAKA